MKAEPWVKTHREYQAVPKCPVGMGSLPPSIPCHEYQAVPKYPVGMGSLPPSGPAADPGSLGAGAAVCVHGDARGTLGVPVLGQPGTSHPLLLPTPGTSLPSRTSPTPK